MKKLSVIGKICAYATIVCGMAFTSHAQAPEFIEIEFNGETSTATDGSYTVAPNEEVVVSVTYKNASIDERYRGGITVSLQGFHGNVLGRSKYFSLGGGDEEYCNYYLPGDEIYIFDSSDKITCRDDMIESHDTLWDLNEVQTLTFRFRAAAQPETFQMYVRGWLCDRSWDLKELNPQHGERDQQGGPCFVYTVQVESPGQPDLAADIDCYSTPWTWGDSVVCDLEVRNIGAEEASDIRIDLVASDNAGNDVGLDTWENVDISPNDQWTVNDYSLDLPGSPYSGLPANGKVYYHLVASEAVGEEDVANNDRHDGVTMSEPNAAPTIVVSRPSTAVEIQEGGVVTLGWSGEDHDSSADADVELFYDDDRDFGNGGRTTIASGLSEGASYSWTVPALGEGTFYVGAIIDDGAETAHAYADGSIAIVDASGDTVTRSSDPTLVDTRDLKVELTDIELSPAFGSHKVDIRFYGKVVNQFGEPAEDVTVGIDDPWKMVSTQAEQPTCDDGEFFYRSSASGDSGIYLFVFLINDDARISCPVSIEHDDEEGIDVPGIAIRQGAQPVYQIAGSTLSSAVTVQNDFFEGLSTAVEDFASSAGKAIARRLMTRLADEFAIADHVMVEAKGLASENKEDLVALASVLVTAYAKPGFVVDDAMDMYLNSVVDDMELPTRKKVQLKHAIKQGFYNATAVGIAAGGGVVDLSGYSLDKAEYVANSVSFREVDGSQQIEFLTRTSEDEYAAFALRFGAPDPYLEVENPNDGTLLVRSGGGAGGRYCLYRRIAGNGPGGWGTPLATFGFDDVYEYPDEDVNPDVVYEYTIMPEGMTVDGPVVAGKAERVVLLVRGVAMLDHNPDESQGGYWEDLRAALADEGYRVWDACYDDSEYVDQANLISGGDNWKCEADRLKEYLLDKILAYDDRAYPHPSQVDLVAHSMGALISREAIADGMVVPARKLITLSGTHHGSVFADFFEPIRALLADILGWSEAHVEAVADQLLSNDAIKGLQPDFVEQYWPQLPKEIRLYVAGGTTAQPNLWCTERLNELNWNTTYDGIVSIHSTLAGPRQPGIHQDYWWLPGELKSEEQRSFHVDHFDICHDSEVMQWVKDCLAGEESALTKASAIRPTSFAETTDTDSDSYVILAWEEESVYSQTNEHIIAVDTLDTLEPSLMSYTNVTGTLRSPTGSVYDLSNSIEITDPVCGLWTAQVYQASSATRTSSYTLVVSAQSDASMDYGVSSDPIYHGSTVSFDVGDTNAYFAMNSISGEVSIAEGSLSVTQLPLMSTESGGSATWGPVSTSGFFTCRYDVEGQRTSGEMFQRVHLLPITVEHELLRFVEDPSIHLINPNRDDRLERIDVRCPLMAFSNVTVQVLADVSCGSNLLYQAKSPVMTLEDRQEKVAVLSISAEEIELATDSSIVVGPFTARGTELDGRVLATHTAVTSTVLNASSVGIVDSDGDGLSDADEDILGLASDMADTDGDGISDSDELLVCHSQPNDPDTDGDGMNDGAEKIAGTGLLDSYDVFQIQEMQSAPDGSVVFRWDGIGGRRYYIESTTNLHPPSWTNAPTGDGPDGESTREVHTNAPQFYQAPPPTNAAVRWYRIKVEQN